MTTTAHRPDTNTLEHLDFDPACEVAMKGEPMCEQTANFHIRYHACERTVGESFICADHLAKVTLLYQESIKRTRGHGRCAGCSMPIAQLSDVLWDVTPIHP